MLFPSNEEDPVPMANPRQPRRRDVLNATIVAGAALLAGAAAPDLPAPEAPPDIWASSYWASKRRDGQEIRLATYRKRLGAPAPGEAPRPVLVLVHGSSPAALASFDLVVPGHPEDEYSLMNVFARRGYDVWTLDHEGYGRSTRTDGNSDIASGVQDLIAATDLIRRETGQDRAHLLGESSGAIRAAAFAQAQPERIGRLVLAAFTYTGAGSPTLAERSKQTEFFRAHNRRPRDRAMLESIFTRDRPGTTDPDVVRAFVEKEMVNGDSVPTGTYLDMTANLPLVDPARVLAPVLLAKGEYDGISTLEDLQGFFDKLPNGDRQLAVIRGAAHSVIVSRSHKAFQHVAASFLSMPEVPASF
ncbi:MAG: alpha/beta fold hydrolase [Acetobacteraceae bacterium]|nr:alpha/beta fold hydrolase [Acetobacteraceae bacterium]